METSAMYGMGAPPSAQVNYYYHHPGSSSVDHYSSLNSQTTAHHHHHHIHHQALSTSAAHWKASSHASPATHHQMHGHWEPPSMSGSVGHAGPLQTIVHGDAPVPYESEGFSEVPMVPVYGSVDHRDMYSHPHCQDDKQCVSRAAAEMLLSLKQINFPDDPRQYYSQNGQYDSHRADHDYLNHPYHPPVQPVSVNFQMTMSCISGVAGVPAQYNNRSVAPPVQQVSPKNPHDHFRQKRHLPPHSSHSRNHIHNPSDYSSNHHNAVDKVNICGTCRKCYARPSTLKTHMRTHSGEKPYICSLCPKTFTQAANLTAHMRTHSGEKPFRCPVCDRRFSQSSSVTTHMRTHSGERPYRCRVCKKAFSDSSTLTKHVRIHSGEKPYQCQLCLLRFSQSGNLNRHMKVHSGERGG